MKDARECDEDEFPGGLYQLAGEQKICDLFGDNGLSECDARVPPVSII